MVLQYLPEVQLAAPRSPFSSLEAHAEESFQKKRKGRKSQFLFTAQLLGKWNLFRDFQRVQIYSIAHKKQK